MGNLLQHSSAVNSLFAVEHNSLKKRMFKPFYRTFIKDISERFAQMKDDVIPIIYMCELKTVDKSCGYVD